MIEGFEHEGQWWFVDEPNNKISGILKYNHKDGVLLKVRLPENSIMKYENPDIILGKSHNNTDITLNNCRLIQIQGIFGEFRTCIFWAEIAFVGAHFPNTEDIKFTSIDISYSYLDKWIGVTGFTFTHSEEDEVIIKYRSPSDIRVDIDEYSRIIFTPVLHTEFSRVQEKAGVEQKWITRIEKKHEAPLDDFLNIIRHLQTFLCLAVREPVHVLKLEGKTKINKELDINYYPDVGIYYQSPYISKPSEYFLGEVLFSYQDISEDFSDILKKWFEKIEVLKPICGLYFGVLVNPYLYPENLFLNLVQAVEGFHRRIFGGKNKLRKRLEDLLNEHAETVPQLLGNREYFLDVTKDTRHYLSHYFDKDKSKHIAEGAELITLAKKLRVLLEVCLIMQTGLYSDKAKEFFSRNRMIPSDTFGAPPIGFKYSKKKGAGSLPAPK